MKIALIVMFVALCALPVQEAKASAPNADRAAKQWRNANALQAKQENKVKNRQQAAQIVKENYRAKVLSVQSASVEGRQGYKAKLLDAKGLVFYVFVDAASGKMRRL